MITILFLFAFILRLVACITPAIWYDEAYSLYVASLPVSQIIALRDFTPPLWEIILHPFVTLWHDVLTIRFVAFAFSMLAMWLAYLIARELQFTRTQTSFAMFMIAVLPGLTWMSSDGRSYAMLSCLYLAGALCVLKRNNIGLFAVSIAMLYTHVTSVFFIASLFVFAYMRGETIRRLAIIGAGLALAWLPWILVIVDMLTVGGDSRPFAPVTPAYFVNNFAASFFIGSAPLLWVLGFALVLITTLTGVKSYALVFAPLALIVMASAIGKFNLVTYRTLSPALMPFALVTARHLLTDRRRMLLACVWSVCLMFCGWAYRNEARGGEQKEAAQLVQSRPAPIVYGTLTVAMPFDYYLDAPSCILTDQPTYGFVPCEAEDLTAPYWFIYPDDPIIPPAAYQQMVSIAAHGTLEKDLQYLQISPVNIYFVEGR